MCFVNIDLFGGSLIECKNTNVTSKNHEPTNNDVEGGDQATYVALSPI